METFKREVKWVLTSAEIRDLSEGLAKAVLKRAGLEDELKISTAAIKAQIAEAQEEINRSAKAVSSGFEIRVMDCAIERDTTSNTVTTIIVETGEILHTRPMTVSERQEILDLANEKVGAGEKA